MKRKTTKGSRLRLSPNEETQLIREELERRRKLRVQQVREQERNVALQVRREVKERKGKALQGLADTLREEWQTQQRKRMQSLEKLFESSIQSVGQGHRSAKQSEPDWSALTWKRERNKEQAAVRYQQALKDLISCRRAQEEHRTGRFEARHKALMVEKDRASKVALLPRPAPDPIENIGIHTLQPPRMTNIEHYSITHYHVPETVVHRETNFEQLNAQQAAMLEAQRLEELEREEACDRKEQLEKVQLRGDHALRKERVVQDQARLLCELEHLYQADLQWRSRVLNTVPAHIYQPLYRHEELRNEHQEKLETAFQNLYTADREVKGDLELQLLPEPLPVPSVGSHDEDLDVTLDLDITPHEEAEEWGKSGTSPRQPVGSSICAVRTGRQPLRRLLDRIRNQREQWSSQEDPLGHGKATKDNSSIETGSMSNQEWEQVHHLEQATPPQLETKSPKVVKDCLGSGSVLQLEENLTDTETRVQESELLKQQQEQLALLQELEEKRYSLEFQLQEANKYKQKQQQALPVHAGTCSLQNMPTDLQVIPGPASDLDHLSGVEADSMHTQSLLDQKRLHKKFVGDAWRCLEEYQKTLNLRYTAITTTTADIPPHPETEETVCPLTSFSDMPHHAALTHVSESNPGLHIPLETPHSYRPVVQTESHTPANPAQNLLPKPPQLSDDALSVLDNHQEANVALASTLGASSLSEERPRDGASEQEDIPLPPPSVVLELLLHNVKGSKMGTDWWAEEQVRKQGQDLQTPLKAKHIKVESSSLMEERNRLSTCTSQCHVCTCSSFLVSSECTVCKSERRVQVHTPISRPTRTLQILLQDLVQHKLSTIQEVDTPSSVILDKGAEVCMQRSSEDCSDYSESSSAPVSPASVESGGRKGLTSGSDVISSENGTCSGSRLSWRETLQLESTGSNAQSTVTAAGSLDQSQQDEPRFVLPHDGTSAEPDHLSSTTISTGSYSTYEEDPNCSKTDSSAFSSKSARRARASYSSKFNSGLQSIIDKYTSELDTSLREVETDTFWPLSPEVTHNATADCSPLDVPVVEVLRLPPVGDSPPNGDTPASGWLNPGCLDASPDGLKLDALLQSPNALQMSLEEFRVSYNSLVKTQKSPMFADVSLMPYLSPTNTCHNDGILEAIRTEFPAKEAASEVTMNLQLRCGNPHSFRTEHQSAPGPADGSKWKEMLEPYSEKGIDEESEISLVTLSDVSLENDYNPPPLKEEQSGGRDANEKLEKGASEDDKLEEIQPKSPHHDTVQRSTRER